MNREDFKAGKPFRFDMDLNGIYLYDGLVLKKKIGDYFEYYCEVTEIESEFFRTDHEIFGMDYIVFIVFTRCQLVEL